MEQVSKFTFNENTYSSWSAELGSVVSCDHADHMPTLSFLLGGYWLELEAADYVQPILQDGVATGECYLCIADYGSDDRWVLGNTFMQGYYSVFNMDSQQFGFAPGAASSKSDIVTGTDPTRFAELDEGLVAGLSVAIAALLGVSIWMIVKYLCKGVAPLRFTEEDETVAGSGKKASVFSDLSEADTSSLVKALQSM